MKLLDSEILFLDNHLLVVNKPHNLLTLPTDLEEDSLQTRAKSWLKDHFHKPGNVFLQPVHRLDRQAAGIVLCARTSKALSRLSEELKGLNWVKRYKVRFEGRLPSRRGRLRHFLKREEEYRTAVVPEGTPYAKEALLDYEVVGEGVAIVQLITGRYHQIRAQFAAVGCPIAGDQKYGSTLKAVSPGIDLVHIELQFIHPISKQLIVSKL